MPRNIKELLFCSNCLKPLAENKDHCSDCQDDIKALSYADLTPEQMYKARMRIGKDKNSISRH